jgi:AraC-like DNA-binding protein
VAPEKYGASPRGIDSKRAFRDNDLALHPAPPEKAARELPSKPTMSSEQPLEQLDRYPLFRTTDPDQMIYGHLSTYGALAGEVRNRYRFAAWGNLLRLPSIALGFGGSTVATSVEYSEVLQFRFQVARRGHAQISLSGVTTTIDKDHASVISPGYAHRIACSDDHDRLSLALNARALERTVISLLGLKPRIPLVFDIATDLRNPHARYLQDLLAFLTRQFDSDAAPLPALVVRELEQAVIVAFLRANPNSLSHLLEGDVREAAPQEIYRAEQYIEANWDKPITIEELVAVTNVSARALFKSFRKFRGYSPMSFAKSVRLRRARQMLKNIPSLSVTNVAFRCGFGNLGHFAKDYREAFDELPSETRSRLWRS